MQIQADEIDIIQTPTANRIVLDGSYPYKIKFTMKVEAKKKLKGDVLFVIDCSESMQSIDNNKLKRMQILNEFIKALGAIGQNAIDDVFVGVLGWDCEIYTQYITRDRTKIIDFARNVLPNDDVPDTNFTLALNSALEELRLRGRPNFVFSWDDVPGKDSEKLIEFLAINGVDWIKTAKIEKINNNQTIEVSADKKMLSLKLNEEQTEVHLKINLYRNIKFIAKKENSRLNIYRHDYSLIIIITDGIRDGNKDTFCDKNGLASEAENMGHKIFSIGFNMPESTRNFFQNMSNLTRGAYFSYEENNLDTIIKQIIEPLEDQIVARNAELTYVLQPYMEKPLLDISSGIAVSKIDDRWMIKWDIGSINAGSKKEISVETVFKPIVPITSNACDTKTELKYINEMYLTRTKQIRSELEIKPPSIIDLIRNKIKI